MMTDDDYKTRTCRELKELLESRFARFYPLSVSVKPDDELTNAFLVSLAEKKMIRIDTFGLEVSDIPAYIFRQIADACQGTLTGEKFEEYAREEEEDEE